MMDKRIIIGGVAVVAIAAFLLSQGYIAGTGFESGRLESGSHISSVNIFKAAKDSKYGYYLAGQTVESIKEEVEQDDAFVDTFCVQEEKMDCSLCEQEAQANNKDPNVACRSRCSRDYDHCEETSRTLYATTTTRNTTYFGKAYDCVAVSNDAMERFGTSVDICNDDGHDEICDGTDTSVSLRFYDSVFTWAYPQMIAGDKDDIDSGNNPLMPRSTLQGVNTNVYTIDGWADTNIRYVSPDGISKSTLEQSGYFSVIQMLSKTPANATEIAACKSSCPSVTKRCSRSTSTSTYERCKRTKAEQEKARANCLNDCESLETCIYDINGVATRQGCSQYSKQHLIENRTIRLFIDATPRIYSPTSDFTSLVDMRGGSANTLLCNEHIVTCGDSRCEADESCSSCPGDCGACQIFCGDNICNAEEICTNCPDCACGNDTYCDSGTCRAAEADEPKVPDMIICTAEARLCPDGSSMQRAANCTWLPEKCAPTIINGTPVTAEELVYCGDGVCEPWKENCSSCEYDCGLCIQCITTSNCRQPSQFGVEAAGSNVCVAGVCQWQESAGDSGTASIVPPDTDSWVIISMIILVGLGAVILVYRMFLSQK